MFVTNWLEEFTARISQSRSTRSRRRRPQKQDRRTSAAEHLENRTLLTTLIVDSVADSVAADGGLTLREAILIANDDSGATTHEGISSSDAADTITFDAALVAGGDAVISLDMPSALNEAGFSAFVIDSEITISGPDGDNGVIIERDSGAGEFRLFHVQVGGDLTIENLTLSGGIAEGGDGLNGGGGGAGLGGAIFNQGDLTIRSSMLSGNVAQGGNGASGTLGGGGGLGADASGTNGAGPNGGTGSGNDGGFGGGGSGGSPTFGSDAGDGGFGGGGGSAYYGGNGGFGGGGSAAGMNGGIGGFGGGFAGDIFFGSPAGGGGGAGIGGAVFNMGGNVTITNSTVSANSALPGSRAGGGGDGAGFGGGLFNRTGTVTVTNSTFAGNTAPNTGGAIYNLGDEGTAELTLNNTIAADSSNAADVVASTRAGGTSISGGVGNLIENATGFNGTVVSTDDPGLGPLTDNGGPTFTHAIDASSPAADAGDNAAVAGLAADQRGTGFGRILEGTVDIGAFESAPPPTGPGGVFDDLQLWLKGDSGITESGGSVSGWTDQGTNGFVSSQTVGASQPTLLDDAVNFNPAVRFDGTNDQLVIPGGILGSDTYDDFHVYVVNSVNDVQRSYLFWESTVSARAITHLPWVNGRVFLEPQQGPNSITTLWDGDIGEPELWSFQHSSDNEAPSGQNQHIVRNGDIANSDDSAVPFIGNNQDFHLGANEAGTHLHSGDVSELIILTGDHTALDHQKIQSYLATKYGITVSQNLVDSDGTVFWDATANAVYQNDVAAIGRDDDSQLDQQKSKSENDDTLLTIDNGGAFADDQSFLAWGNNAGSTAIDTESGPQRHMGRVWKVSESGTVGEVTISVPTSTGAVNILVDDDGDFSTGATLIPLTESGGELTANVDFANGQFFTLADEPFFEGPGGVFEDLKLWLKADAGVTQSGGSVSDWTDQGTNGFVSSQAVGASQPTLVADAVNFNPTIRFDGDDDRMVIPGGILGTDTYDDFHVYVINSVNEVQRSYLFWESTDTARVITHLPWFNGTVFYQPEQGGGNSITTPWAGDLGESELWSFQHSTDNDAPSGQTQNIVRNGTVVTQEAGGIAFTGNNNNFHLGSNSSETDLHSGDVSELIILTGDHTALEHQQIQSYLAAKYGITVSHNLVDSEGAIIWDVSANAAFQNDVAAIGRDDESQLDQQKSRSVNGSALVTIDNGGAFDDDESFLAWGNNAGSTAVDNVVGANTLMSRQWKVAETGAVGEVTISIPDSFNVDLLLVDDDGDFSSGAADFKLTTVGGMHTATVDLTNGQVFTFALAETPPDSFVVTTATDENDGSADSSTGAGTSLREAIIAANANPNQSTITFAAGIDTTLTLTGALDNDSALGDLDITTEVTIRGNGVNNVGNTVISGGADIDDLANTPGISESVFHVVAGGNLSVEGVTITGGNTGPGRNGGGLVVSGGAELSVVSSTISGNSSSQHGGGIYNVGTVHVTNSSISGNATSSRGGGISNDRGATLTVSNSTISDNNAFDGAAMDNSSGSATIANSTISGNTASNFAGGIRNFFGSVAITNSTIFGSSTGLYSLQGTITLNNTIVAGTKEGADVAYGSFTGSNNLIEDGSGPGLTGTVSGAPML